MERSRPTIEQAGKTCSGLALKSKTQKNYVKSSMNRFEPLRLATMLLWIIPFGCAFAAERLVPAQYPTIQAAVNAAVPGDTVRIAPGNYAEQVVVAFKTGLTLAGEPGAVLHAFPGMGQSLLAYGRINIAVCAIYRSDIVVRGLHFEGENLGGSLPQSLEGLLFVSAGGVATNCTFSGFRPVGSSLPAVARALFCVNLVAEQTGVLSVTIAGNTFTNNQVALQLRGDPVSNPEQLRLTVKVHGNIITGFGPDPGWNSGIWLNPGVAGDVTQNFFSGFAGTVNPSPAIAAYDAAAQTRSRFAPLQPVNFESNTFTNNGEHLMLIGGNGSRVVNNTFLGSVPEAMAVALAWGGLRGFGLSGTNILVANNNFSDMPTGILLYGTETWPSPWPTVPSAANPSLVANWFCNVSEPIRVNPLVTLWQGQGTETNCPFAPRFQSLTSSSTGESLAFLRGWHGDSYVIEASTNLQDWAPAHTNSMALPLFEFRDTNTPASPQRFYRAFKQYMNCCPPCSSDFA